MRILHTSDWHLGRTFHGASLIDEQREAVDRLVGLAVEHRVDLVVIAGDLFDRAIPPTEAIILFDDALAALRGTGATVVAIAGNHDSATRVGVNDRLLATTGVTIRGDVRRLLEPIVLPVDDGGAPVAVYPVPYLEPSLVGPQLAALAGAMPADADAPADAEATDDAPAPRRRLSHHDVTAQAMDLIRAHAATIGPVRTVVVAHTFVAGGTTSESERDLTIGNVDLVDVSAFAGIDYVALGHLHGHQKWDGGRIAYSGTPLPYSFSEEGHTKSARLVELAADGTCTAEDLPLGVGRPLRTLRGTIDDLLHREDLADAVDARVRIKLTDPILPLQAMVRLQQRFPHAVVLHHEPEGVDEDTKAEGIVTLIREAKSPLQLATAFWTDQQRVDATDDQLEVLRLALAHAGAEDEG